MLLPSCLQVRDGERLGEGVVCLSTGDIIGLSDVSIMCIHIFSGQFILVHIILSEAIGINNSILSLCHVFIV